MFCHLPGYSAPRHRPLQWATPACGFLSVDEHRNKGGMPVVADDHAVATVPQISMASCDSGAVCAAKSDRPGRSERALRIRTFFSQLTPIGGVTT